MTEINQQSMKDRVVRSSGSDIDGQLNEAWAPFAYQKLSEKRNKVNTLIFIKSGPSIEAKDIQY